MVLAFPLEQKTQWQDFKDFGDYLLMDRHAAKRRIVALEERMAPTFAFLKKRYSHPTILDFGAGAGFLCAAAQHSGMNVFGIEPSDKLRAYARDVLGLDDIVESIFDLDVQFDAVLMYDVIEHLPPDISRETMERLASIMKSNSILLGQTPNFKSANIRLCRDKDPVIWPPSHSCYFSSSTLHQYLQSFGFQKVSLYSRGLSSNSFFRKRKSEKSFIEKGKVLPLTIFMKQLFRLLGYFMQPFDSGYQIHFRYLKP